MKTTVMRVEDSSMMRAFRAVPAMVYGEDSIPPPAQSASRCFSPFNPLLQHLRFAAFVAFQDGRPVGRIAATADTLNPRPGEGFWGCFECIDSPDAAAALLDAAAGWLEEQNKTVMTGPATLNTNQAVGLLIKGFEHPPLPELPYNPPYYQKLVEGAGLKTCHHLQCLRWEAPEKLPEQLVRAEPFPGLVIRPVNYRAIPREARFYQEFHNNTMSKNWGFIPITINEAVSELQSLSRRVPPELFTIFEAGDKVVGLGISIPYQSPDRDGAGGLIRHAIGGVMPEFRGKGVHLLLVREMFKNSRRLGFTRGEGSQVAESNTRALGVVHPLFSDDIIKQYRVYSRPLE